MLLRSVGTSKNKRSKLITMKNLLAIAALFCFAIFAAACGAPAANNANNSNVKPASSPAATTPATTAPATTTTAPKADDKKTDVAAGDSVGVAECDEYIKKYEACLTSIAAKAPAVEGPMKTAFQAQRDGFKKAASTPEGKATLPGICKKAIETAKASTSVYACTW